VDENEKVMKSIWNELRKEEKSEGGKWENQSDTKALQN